MSSEGDKPRRLVRFTPLRYPGGKGKLAAYLKSIIEANRLHDGEYVEPYAGGAAIAFELLFQEYVSRIHINDLSRPIFSFWQAVLNDTNELCRLERISS
jgi:DNA adenine methylase